MQQKITLVVLFLGIILFNITGCDNSPIEHLAINPDYQRQLSSVIPHTEKKIRKATISDVYYELNIDLTQQDRYAGTIDIRFMYQKTPFPVTFDFAGGEIERIWLNNNISGIDYNGQFLALPSEQLIQGVNRVRLQFSRPFSQDGEGINRYTDALDQQNYLYHKTHIESGHHLFPMFNQSDLPFKIKAIITTHNQWKLFSSLTTEKTESRGDFKLWHLLEQQTNASKISLIAGNWHEWRGRAGTQNIRVLVRQSIKDIIPIRGWYQRIQDASKVLLDYADDYQGSDDITLAILPGAYAYETYQKDLIAISEHPYLFENALHPHWQHFLVKQLVSIGMANKSLAEHWSKPWFSQFIEQQLFSETANKRYNNSVIQHIQPGIRVISRDYDQIRNNLENYSLISRKAPLLLNGLSHHAHGVSLNDAVRSYITTPELNFSDFLDLVDTRTSLTALGWATQWLDSPGYNLLSTSRVCRDNQLNKLTLKQTSHPNYPQLRDLYVQITYAFEERIVTNNYEMLSEELVLNDWSELPCDTGLLITTETAITRKLSNRPGKLIELSQNYPGLNLVDMWEANKASNLVMADTELTGWINLVRERLAVISVTHLQLLINELLEHASLIGQSEQLTVAKTRLSERLLEMSQVKTASSAQRIIWFKLYIHLLDDLDKTTRLVDWFIGNTEPKDLRQIESLQIEALGRLFALNHPQKEILFNIYQKDANELYTPYIMAVRNTYLHNGSASDFIGKLLKQQNLWSEEYAATILHPAFVPQHQIDELISLLASELVAIEQKLGTRLLQLWLEPLLHNQCNSPDRIQAADEMSNLTGLSFTTKQWMEQIRISCAITDYYQAIDR